MIRWIKSGVKLHADYIVFGKPSAYKGKFNIAHPELDLQEEKKELIDVNRQFIELGAVIKNPSLGRKSKEDITVCDLTGTGVQDTAIARHTFDLAK